MKIQTKDASGMSADQRSFPLAVLAVLIAIGSHAMYFVAAACVVWDDYKTGFWLVLFANPAMEVSKLVGKKAGMSPPK